MRIARQSRLVAQLMPEVLQVVVIQSPQQVAPRIHARRRMPLVVDQVPRLLAPIVRKVLRAKEVVVPHLLQRRLRRVRRNVSANSRVLLVLPMHHRHGIPPDQRLDPLLQLAVAGVRDLVVFRNCVAERRRKLIRHRDPRLAPALPQRLQQLRGVLPLLRNHVVERLNPLRHLGREVRLRGNFSLHRHSSVRLSPPRPSFSAASRLRISIIVFAVACCLLVIPGNPLLFLLFCLSLPKGIRFCLCLSRILIRMLQSSGQRPGALRCHLLLTILAPRRNVTWML